MAKQGLPDEQLQPERSTLQFPRKRQAISPELRLLSRLQTTLEPAQVLGHYFDALREWLGVSGLEWKDADERIVLGRSARHQHVYRLSLGDELLGELTVTRREQLDERECLIFEQSTGLLVYPLRNACLYQRARAAARRDPLTGLWNRTALDECLQRELELTRRYERPFSLILLDVDNFKLINDTCGHQAGDHVLKALTELLYKSARTSDLIFRYAGDEFVIAMSHTDMEGALTVAHRLREQVAGASFAMGERSIPVSISLGVASAHIGESRTGLFQRVDEALLAAKRAGRDRVGRAA